MWWATDQSRLSLRWSDFFPCMPKILWASWIPFWHNWWNPGSIRITSKWNVSYTFLNYMKIWHRGTCNQIQGKVEKSNSWFTHLNFSTWVINEAFLEQLNNLYIFTVDQTHIAEAGFVILTHWGKFSDLVFSDFHFHLDGIVLEYRQANLIK